MSETRQNQGVDRQSALFMDLLAHDVLNNNQAVMSYLELVLANPDLDAKARGYAEKAISHVKTSTILVEHAKNLMAARSADPNSYRPTDLMRSVMLAIKELPKFFPEKRVKARVVQGPNDAYVIGGALADDLVLNAFIDIARTDPGDPVAIDVRIVKSEHGGKVCWGLVLTDPSAVLLPGMRSEDFPTLLTQDSSKMVKMAGLLFSMIAAHLLGGEFSVKSLASGSGQGGEFALTLVKAGKP